MTPRLLLDSDVMIDFLRGNPRAVSFVSANTSQIILSSIVAAELYAGVMDDQELEKLNALLSLFPVIPVSFEIAKLGGLLKRRYAGSHGVGFAGAILAATAELEGAVLKTLNIRHYPMIQGLKPAYTKA